MNDSKVTVKQRRDKGAPCFIENLNLKGWLHHCTDTDQCLPQYISFIHKEGICLPLDNISWRYWIYLQNIPKFAFFFSAVLTMSISAVTFFIQSKLMKAFCPLDYKCHREMTPSYLFTVIILVSSSR